MKRDRTVTSGSTIDGGGAMVRSPSRVQETGSRTALAPANHGVLQTPGLQIVASRGRKGSPRATGNGATAPPRAPHFSGRKGRVCRCTPQSTLSLLIKSDPASISTEVHDDVKLEDLYTWD